MKSIAVIYQSKYGFTKTYAQWISEALGADLLVSQNVKAEDLKKYTTIVYGGSLYAGGVSGIATITKNFSTIKNKSLYLFTVGAMDVTDPKNIEGIRSSLSHVLTPPMLEAIKIYHFQGGIKYSKLSLKHRVMMGMMVKFLRKKPEDQLSAEDKMMLKTYRQDMDLTNPSAIIPLLEDIKTHGEVK